MNEEESGSSKEQRRLLRQEQRELNIQLVSSREVLSGTGGTSLLARLRKDNDDLFKKADHTREQLNDVLNLRELARASNVQADRLNESSFGYDFDAFATGLMARFYDRPDMAAAFHWEKLGRDAGALFCAAPTFQTLRGGLLQPVKRQAPRAPRAPREQASEVVVPMNVEHGTGKADSSSGPIDKEATNERVKVMHEYFNKNRANKKDALVNLVDILVDPSDPVQTIENFFDFGFLIKEKKVVMDLTADGNPTGVFSDPDKLGEKPSRQVVLTLNMGDLTDIREHRLMDARRCILHRDDPLYAAHTALEQVS
jgi:hypothetical protein